MVFSHKNFLITMNTTKMLDCGLTLAAIVWSKSFGQGSTAGPYLLYTCDIVLETFPKMGISFEYYPIIIHLELAQIIILSTKRTISDWISDARKNWQEASYAEVQERRVK